MLKVGAPELLSFTIFGLCMVAVLSGGSRESWRESNAYRAGDKVVTVETPIGKLGLTVCYDLRFPVWSSNKNIIVEWKKLYPQKTGQVTNWLNKLIN